MDPHLLGARVENWSPLSRKYCSFVSADPSHVLTMESYSLHSHDLGARTPSGGKGKKEHKGEKDYRKQAIHCETTQKLFNLIMLWSGWILVSDWLQGVY